ncbi:hypothetical protein N510_000749 [Firmicutes bacterium ASF500]|nr:hypothetical protein N510_000749 [Firmicutes bacterium ASF500]
MLERLKQNSELLVTGAFAALFVVTFLNAERWINAMTIGEFEIGPYAYPKTVCLISAVMMLGVLFKQIKLLHAGQLPRYEASEEAPTYFTMLCLVAVCMLYIWVMPKIGFILASLILLPVLLLIAGVRNPKTIALFTIGVFLVAFVFFCLLMKLQLPRGQGVFKDFSLRFY